MERKKYLQLCQKNAISPKSVKVLYDGLEYFPEAYQMDFNEKGETQNTAILKDIKANSSLIYVNLKKVEDFKK